MGDQHVSGLRDSEQLLSFMRALLQDVRALELMLERTDLFEKDRQRIGAEQEMFLVDKSGRPSPLAVEALERIQDKRVVPELALFNLEANLSPRIFVGTCLSDMEAELQEIVEKCRAAIKPLGAHVLLVGILPTLDLEDLGLDAMMPNPRYAILNDAISRLRGGRYSCYLKGVDELEISSDNMMLEAANTSFQVHFQVHPREFARRYNLAQAATAPVLAAAVNSPILMGKRLWKETRIAVFQQSVDARSRGQQARGHRPRVDFGSAWVDESILEIFREDIARFRVVISAAVDEDPLALLEQGIPPALTALRLHNGTVYRWNRPCYGVQDGKAHLRIEARAFPAGPSIPDEIANAAFFFGLMNALGAEYEDIRRHMSFDTAKANFLAAARLGLNAQIQWIGGKPQAAADLIQERLLPQAREGLEHAKVDAGDIDRYLGIVRDRVRARRTGAQWMLDSLAAMGTERTHHERRRALVRGMLAQQIRNRPCHDWPLAGMTDPPDWSVTYQTISELMTTDLFTVRPEDLVDLAASVMDWEHLRHVPVEDDEGRLVGLMSHRSLLRLVAQGRLQSGSEPVTVESVMVRHPVTVTPETSTRDAIELMRSRKVGCLPVVKNDKLVGIVTERDFLWVAAALFDERFRSAP